MASGVGAGSTAWAEIRQDRGMSAPHLPCNMVYNAQRAGRCYMCGGRHSREGLWLTLANSDLCGTAWQHITYQTCRSLSPALFIST